MNFASLVLGFAVADANGVDRQRALELGLVAGVANVSPVPATLLTMVLARSIVGSAATAPTTVTRGLAQGPSALPAPFRFPQRAPAAPPTDGRGASRGAHASGAPMGGGASAASGASSSGGAQLVVSPAAAEITAAAAVAVTLPESHHRGRRDHGRSRDGDA